MRILLVEDDKDIGQVLKMQLESECFAVDIASDGEQGSYMARTNVYDAVILDWVLPKKLGPEVCAEIRASGKTMPIIFLTVSSEVASKVQALELGADDYLTKPFSFQELLARLRAVLRRPTQMTSDTLSVEDLTMDVSRQTVQRQQEEIHLTRKEFMLLEYLLRNKGSVISRAELLEHVWDSSVDIFSNTIESHIVSLRRKLNDSRRKQLIHTISGRGYKIDSKK
jgi:two-component system, OmpR family, response regulator